jgi:hypothetical protein
MAKTETSVIEGTWEEVAAHAGEFRGHRLRLTILSDGSEATSNPQIDALKQWFNLPRPKVTSLVDDSRAGISLDNDGRG